MDELFGKLMGVVFMNGRLHDVMLSAAFVAEHIEEMSKWDEIPFKTCISTLISEYCREHELDPVKMAEELVGAAKNLKENSPE